MKKRKKAKKNNIKENNHNNNMVIFFRKHVVTWMYLIMGCALMAFATNQFLLPNQLSTGGFSGIATILYYFLNINMGVSTIALNIPLLIFAYIKIGRKFIVKAVSGTIFLSIFLSMFERFGSLTTDRFLACIYGSIIMGAGSALVFKAEASTGGSDLITTIVRAFRPEIKSSTIVVLIDTIIVILNVLFFKTIEVGLYSAIAIYIMGKVIDIVFEGINFAKIILIVSDKYGEVSNAISKEAKRGVTALYGKGMYTNAEKNILLCVTSRAEVGKIRRIIEKIDPHVFLIISNAREVFGKGFKEK